MREKKKLSGQKNEKPHRHAKSSLRRKMPPRAHGTNRAEAQGSRQAAPAETNWQIKSPNNIQGQETKKNQIAHYRAANWKAEQTDLPLLSKHQASEG